MEAKQIFISYKSEEFDEALWVKETLEANGMTCWMAPMCITGGSSYAAEIPAAINNCKVFVLILSRKVQESRWVARELDQAINANKTIMPFTIVDCQLNDEFGFYLSNIQRYHAYKDKEGTMKHMLRDIKRMLGIPEQQPAKEQPVKVAQPEQEQPAPQPVKAKQPEKPKKTKQPKQPKPRKPMKKWWLPVGIGAVLLGLLIGILVSCSGNKIHFCGNDYKADAYSVTAENQVIDGNTLAQLAKFKELGSIRFVNCTLNAQNLSILSSHPLWKLELENCSLTDGQLQTIDFAAFTRLQELNLSGNKAVTGVNALGEVEDTLTSLNISKTGIGNLEKVGSFTKLEELYIADLGVSSLEPLDQLIYLKKLVADNNHLRTLQGLDNTTILEYVSLNNNALTKIDELAYSAETLQYVYLDDNSLISLEALENCAKLKELSANGNKLTAMPFGRLWTDLTKLSLADNKIEVASLHGPADMQLEYLDLSGNQLILFADYSFTTDYYVYVNLSDNQLVSVTLPAETKYRGLLLHGNPLTDTDFLSELTISKLSMNHYDSLTPEAAALWNATDLYLVDCPANKKVAMEEAVYFIHLIDTEDIPGVIPEESF